MSDVPKPLPVADADSETFWQGCQVHELRAQRCCRCGRFRWPPSGLCPGCHSWDFSWEALPNRGTVVSFVVVHQAPSPAFRDDVPYTIAQVMLDGSGGRVRIVSNIVDCPWEQVRVGMTVEAIFEEVTPQVTLPRFRLIKR